MLELHRQSGIEPRFVSWALTHACNMSCLHCGAHAGKPLSNELSDEEALSVCADLADAGCVNVCLTGGEPLLRKDWPVLAKALSYRGVSVNMVSNGLLFSREKAKQARNVGIQGICFSVDGLSKSHTYLRQAPNSWEKILENLDICQEIGLDVSVITTVYRQNLGDLKGLCQVLTEHGVRQWRLQLAIPQGRMADHQALLISPEQIFDVIPLVAELSEMSCLCVIAGHNIGYYGGCEGYIRRGPKKEADVWFGCVAGLGSALIESNGDVKGCCWERVEGNVRERSFCEIWNDPNAFAYNRKFKIEDLKGFCRTCEYAVVCRGGCSRSVFTNGFPYCYHRLRKERQEHKVERKNS